MTYIYYIYFLYLKFFFSQKNLQPDLYHYSRAKLRAEPLEVKLYHMDAFIKNIYIKRDEFEAITLIEFIEHVPLETLERLFETILGYLQPKLLIITTPNFEFN